MTDDPRRKETPRGRLQAVLAAASLLVLPATLGQAAPARVLDGTGAVLVVGNWVDALQDDGGTARLATSRQLSYELRNASGQLIFAGTVPGTDDLGRDVSPALSRNPVTGEILLVWARDGSTGTTELASTSFVDGAWQMRQEGSDWVADVSVVASGAVDQVDPTVIHDAAGIAFVAWRRLNWREEIAILALSPEGAVLDSTTLSPVGSVMNGAPRLGVDARGDLIVAYFGIDEVEETPRLHVHRAAATGGGVIHVPNPIVELADGIEVPIDGEGIVVGTGGATFPELHLTVLGASPVAWWTAPDATGRPTLRHVEPTATGEWLDATQQVMDLGSGETATDVPTALEALEARLRRVRSGLVAPGDGDQSIDPSPGRLGSITRR